MSQQNEAFTRALNAAIVARGMGAYNGYDYPFFFPSLFGSGQDGDVTLTTNADVGYLGSYGATQAHNATLAAGQTLTIAQGSSSGAFMISCTGTLTIAGTITGNGANGTASGTTVGSSSGAGGATAGGGIGGPARVGVQQSANIGFAGVVPTKYGHGCALQTATWLGRGGGGGCTGNTGATEAGGLVSLAKLGTSSTLVTGVLNGKGLWHPSKRNILIQPIALEEVQVTDFTTTSNDIGPWSGSSAGLFLPRGFVPPACGGPGGSITGGSLNGGGGGGGGGGGTVILEANIVNLVAGYSINLSGGTPGAGNLDGGGGYSGCGGTCIIVCRQLIGSTAAINVNAGSLGSGSGVGRAGAVYVVKV